MYHQYWLICSAVQAACMAWVHVMSTLHVQKMQLCLVGKQYHEWYKRAVDAGRHMLTEMVVDNYIPNDTHMNEDDSRVQVRTCQAEVLHACFQSCYGTCVAFDAACVYLMTPQQCLGSMTTADGVTW